MSLKITQSQNLLVYICMFEIFSQNKLLRITHTQGSFKTGRLFFKK